MFFSGFVFFLTAAGVSYGVFESWIVSLALGTIALVVAVVLVRRGDTIF